MQKNCELISIPSILNKNANAAIISDNGRTAKFTRAKINNTEDTFSSFSASYSPSTELVELTDFADPALTFRAS